MESEPGKGTTFFVRLPVTLGEPAAPVRSTGGAPSVVPQGTPVLVVDDEPIVSNVLTSILNRHGYRATVANSAREALAKLAETPGGFRLVMTDHGMPGMTGLELIAEIKRTHPELPVLLLTGWGENVLQTNVVEAPPDAVLGKPINQTDLLEALARLLPVSLP